MDLAKDWHHVEPQPVTCEATAEVGLVLTPLEPCFHAVFTRLVSCQVEQGPDQPRVAGAHALKRPPARGCQKPVEDGFDLVGRSVAGCDPVQEPVFANSLGRFVTRLPRTCLEIAAI